MPDCFWVLIFELNFLDKNSWVLDNQILMCLSEVQVDGKILPLLFRIASINPHMEQMNTFFQLICGIK